MNRQYVIGTAGHIDHGKTALVKALTGIDTDRLPEEKARGITIDLGFAHFSDNVTIIDVPGHERLIKNMVAGVSTIDLMLLVIAADDGVMPQSREHFDIIRLLEIPRGIVVITKVDLVEEEWLQLVEADVRKLLADTHFADAPVIRTAAVTGLGIETLRSEIGKKLAGIPPQKDPEIFRLPVDRAFSARGFGTVITGTVLGGTLAVGEEVEIQPHGGIARVRGLQSHDTPVESVRIGDRAAVNLAGVDRADITRGMVMTTPLRFQPSTLINARLNLLPGTSQPLKNNQRIRIHLHTAECFARVLIPEIPALQPGDSAFAQLRLETPAHAAFRDRFIIRQYSPHRTIGGGIVLQAHPVRYRKKFALIFQETLSQLESPSPQLRILGSFDRITLAPQALWDIKLAAGVAMDALRRELKTLRSQGHIFSETRGKQTFYFSSAQLRGVLNRIQPALDTYHRQHPGRPGLKASELVSRLERLYPPESIRKALAYGEQTGRLARDNAHFRLPGFSPQLSSENSAVYRAVEAHFRHAGFTPPTIKESMAALDLPAKDFKELTRMLREAGKLFSIDATLLFHSDILAEVKKRLETHFQIQPRISVPEFKSLINASRKHAIPLLEYLDRQEITERVGNDRKPGRRFTTDTE